VVPIQRNRLVHEFDCRFTVFLSCQKPASGGARQRQRLGPARTASMVTKHPLVI
jgi:hypothetical protein